MWPSTAITAITTNNMRLRNSNSSYGVVARVLHWSSVALVLFLLLDVSGLDVPPKLAERALYVERHVVLGSMLLVLMALCFGWRLGNPNPVLAYVISATRRRVVLAVHRTLYGLVFALCLSGLFAWFTDAGGVTNAALLLHLALWPWLLALVVVHAGAGVLNQVFAHPNDAG